MNPKLAIILLMLLIITCDIVWQRYLRLPFTLWRIKRILSKHDRVMRTKYNYTGP